MDRTYRLDHRVVAMTSTANAAGNAGVSTLDGVVALPRARSTDAQVPTGSGESGDVVDAAVRRLVERPQ